MRAVVDKDTCISCGLCVSTEPEVFEMDDDGKAVAVADTTEENKDSVQECIDGCPVDAITNGE
ncbi:MAG: ferredoxin [Roseburia sp.]|nr:ferredoxin [Roseburia sp.]